MNDLQQYFDRLGLPWRESRASLAARYGVRRCHWSLSDVVELDIVPPPFPSLLRPVQFRHEAQRSEHMPPTYLSAYADPFGEAMRNLYAVVETVEAELGPGQFEDGSVNARSFFWQSGPARLHLHCFPAKLQEFRGRNAWHEREPRLPEACDVGIVTGYRPPLSNKEREWVDTFVPAITLHDGRLPPEDPDPAPRAPGWLDRLFGARARPVPADLAPSWANPVQAHVGNSTPSETGLEYVREPPPSVERVFGNLGQTPGGQALVWCDEQLRIVPRQHLRALRLERYEPERGGEGDAALLLRCGPPGEEGGVDVPLASRYGTDSLDELANDVTDWLGMPLAEDRR